MLCLLKGYPLTSGRKDKFLVILNLDPGESVIYHALTTSRVERWRRLAFAASGIFIQGGTVPALPRDTIVDCFSLPDPLVRDFLFTEFCVGNLIFQQPLPADVMERIEEALRSSPRIPLDVKARILRTQ